MRKRKCTSVDHEPKLQVQRQTVLTRTDVWCVILTNGGVKSTYRRDCLDYIPIVVILCYTLEVRNGIGRGLQKNEQRVMSC